MGFWISLLLFRPTAPDQWVVLRSQLHKGRYFKRRMDDMHSYLRSIKAHAKRGWQVKRICPFWCSVVSVTQLYRESYGVVARVTARILTNGTASLARFSNGGCGCSLGA